MQNAPCAVRGTPCAIRRGRLLERWAQLHAVGHCAKPLPGPRGRETGATVHGGRLGTLATIEPTDKQTEIMTDVNDIQQILSSCALSGFEMPPEAPQSLCCDTCLSFAQCTPTEGPYKDIQKKLHPSGPAFHLPSQCSSSSLDRGTHVGVRFPVSQLQHLWSHTTSACFATFCYAHHTQHVHAACNQETW